MPLPDSQQTIFNAGIAALMRLDKQLQDCNEYSRLCNVNGPNLSMLNMYRNTVFNVFKEIGPKLDTKDENVVRSMFNAGMKLPSLYQEVRTKDGTVSEINLNSFNQHWHLYNNVEMKLRRYADERGMLIPNKPSTDDLISDME